MSSPLPPEIDPAQISAYSPKQWQDILRNAQTKLRTQPRDPAAWSAVQDASDALKNSEAYPQHGQIDQLSKFNSPGLTPESMSSGAKDFFKNLAYGAGGEVAAAPLAAGARLLAPYAKESLAPIVGLGKPIANAARSVSNKVLPNIVKENFLPSGVTSWLKGAAEKVPDPGEEALAAMRQSSASARTATVAAPEASAASAPRGQSTDYVRRMNNPDDPLDVPAFLRRRGPAGPQPPLEPHEVSPSTFDALKSAADKASQTGAQSAADLSKFSSAAEPSALTRAIEQSKQLQAAGKHGEAAKVLEEALTRLADAPKPHTFPTENLNSDATMGKILERKTDDELLAEHARWAQRKPYPSGQPRDDQADPVSFLNLLREISKRGLGDVGSMPSDFLKP